MVDRLPARRGFAVRALSLSIAALSLAGAASTASAAAFPNKAAIYVYRVGDGTLQTSGAGAPVFIDVFSPQGALLQSIPMPTVASGTNNPLVTAVQSSSEGMLSRSDNYRYLAAPGYAVPAGTASVSSASSTVPPNPRVVGVLDVDAGTVDTSTTHTPTGTVAITTRGAAIDNTGTTVWSSTSSTNNSILAQSVGTSSATQILTTGINGRNIRVQGGQLYLSTGSGTGVPRIYAIGTGTPTTSGQSSTALANVSSTDSTYGFYFADLDGAAGVDTLYAVSDSPDTLTKYSLVSGTWTSNGTVNVGTDPRGLDGYVSGGVVNLFITRVGGTSTAGGGELVSIIDSAGFNAPISSTSATLLATAGANTAFRGLAYIPEPATFATLGIAGVGLLARRRKA